MEFVHSTRIGNAKIEVYSEAPRYRMMFWHSDRRFYLPMPYVHYFIDTTSSYSWLRSLGMSNRSLSEDPEISSACLPNLYGFYHCGDGHGATPEDSVNTYWSGTFTRDGQLANNAVWREMARRSGFKMVQKAAILQWWEENLTIQDILDMPWNWNSSKHYKEVMKL